MIRMIEHTNHHFGSKLRRQTLRVYTMTHVPSNMTTLRSYRIPSDSIPADVPDTITINSYTINFFMNLIKQEIYFEYDTWEMEYSNSQSLIIWQIHPERIYI
mmetsp:Transcript_5592/g.8582  ORF Transcript_5592/g.8582 Transcript_5592/m.8582 type:complete len:102 (+) Transcript_5592:281-586(+)